jgi:hypothetical protein
MSDKERNDIKTRFKKGQSGNPTGRPKGNKSTAAPLREAFLKTIRVRDGQGTRDVPKIVLAAEVCLNNAIKGDLKSFVKIMEMIDKFKLMEIVAGPPPITEIRRVIVDPRQIHNDEAKHQGSKE